MADHDRHDEHEDGYAGPAVLVLDGRELPVQVRLDAHHEPQDGRLHWFGRVTVGPGADPGALEALRGAADVELRTGGHRAAGRIGDVDPWGRYRVSGVGAPPYRRQEPELG